MLSNNFIKVSVRGRYAYGLFCLESFFEYKKYDTSVCHIILDNLWSFVGVPPVCGKWCFDRF